MIVLGIDPGTVVTGYAVIQKDVTALRVVDIGIIKPPKNNLLSIRYHAIYQSCRALMQKYGPDQIAIETPFVHKNMQSALKLGGAVASVMIAAIECNLPIYGYAPKEVKHGVCGYGTASKEEIQNYICPILRLDKSKIDYLDATDAIAIALHHIEQQKYIKKATSNSLQKTAFQCVVEAKQL